MRRNRTKSFFGNSKRIISGLIAITSVFFMPTAEVVAQQKDSIVQLPVFELTDTSVYRRMPVSVINAGSLEQIREVDLGEILRRQPNVSGIRRGGYALDPVVRGFRYSQISVFLDEGIHIEGGCPNRMDPVLAHIEPEQVNSLEIVKGPYLLQYGPAPSASIHIKTRPDQSAFNRGFHATSHTGFDAGRNGLKQHISLLFSAEKAFLSLGGGIKDYDNYTDGNGKEWNSSFTKKDISADAGFRTGKSGFLILSYRGSFGKDILFPALPMDETIGNTNIFSGYFERYDPANPEKRLTLSAYHSKVYHVMDNSFRPQYSQVVPPYNGIMQATAIANASSTGGRFSISYPFKSLNMLHGIDTRITTKDGTRDMRMIMIMDGQEYTSEKKINLWRDALIFNTGLFTSAVLKKGKTEAFIAARLDLNHAESGDTLIVAKEGNLWYKSTPVNQLLYSISGNITYRLTKKTTIGVGLARSQRAGDMQERYIKFLATGFDRYDYLGNPLIKPETNHQADLMLTYRPGKAQLLVNLFISRIDNYITGVLLPPNVARPLSQGAPGVKQFGNVDAAVFTGLEASLSWIPFKNSNIGVSGAYTFAYFTKAEKIILENNQLAGTEVIKNDPVPEIPALDATMIFSYKFRKPRLKPQLTVRAVAAQNHVSISYYEEKSPGYVITDLALNYYPHKSVSLSAGVSNLFDIAYYDHLNRRLLGSNEKLYEPGRSFYINLKIKI